MDSHQLGPRKRMCYMHCDVNSFYASVEEARLYPNLENKPVAVRQRDLLVTTNHIARARGVPKMCSASEGLRLVPDLVKKKRVPTKEPVFVAHCLFQGDH